MLRFLTVLGFFLISIRSSGQNGEVLPVQFDHFFQNYSLIHPAATGLHPSAQVYLGHRALANLFQGVNTSYAGINYRFDKKDSLSGDYHGLGAAVINDREGAYFNRGRIYFSYAWHNRIAYNWILSAGVTAGVINYFYRGSNIHAGGSALRPTADAGLFIYNENKTHFGLTINQVIPGTMAPLESQLRIKRHVTFSADKNFFLSSYFSLVSAMLLRAPVKKKSFDLDLYLMGKVQHIFMAGIQYKHQKGYSILGGVSEVPVGKKTFSFFISYFAPFSWGQDLKVNRMEGTCRIGI